MTNRYLPARNAFLRPLFRLALPIAFFGSTIAAAGCLQQIGAPGEPSVPVKQKLPVVLSAPNVAPREDSPASTPRLMKLVDIDEDKALDLVILDGGTDHPIHIRFASHEPA